MTAALDSAVPSTPCPCCGDARRTTEFVGQERQLPVATAAQQRYATCATCASWYAIAGSTPFNAAAHYPGEYYSFAPISDSRVTAFLRGQRARHVLGQSSLLGGLLIRRLGVPDALAAIAKLRVTTSTSICDVGAGSGRLLHDLHAAGFTRLLGCDPFGPDRAGPPRIVRDTLEHLTSSWDLLMYHHCLEHIDDPLAELRHAAARLTSSGAVLVRVPLADSDAAATYGARWVQLDAPRHRVIPTQAGMQALAARAGLRVVDAWRDSSAFQFWGSELYRQDKALRSVNDPRTVFSAAQMTEWMQCAEALNASGRGDQGVFVLRRAT